MKTLKINLRDLEDAFEMHSPESESYLDSESGEIVLVTDDMRRELEMLLEAAGPKAGMEEIIQGSDVADWQKKVFLDIHRVDEGGERFSPIPAADSHTSFSEMEEFTAEVQDARVREALTRALGGKGTFRRFRDVLDGTVREREQWFKFKQVRLRQQVLDWLTSMEIEAIDITPAPEPGSQRPPVRAHLLEGVRAFALAARKIPGVQRIALIGSLAAEQPNPGGADLLVTVADDLDLAGVARLGRKLSGHALQLNRAGEVFLANPQEHYIGRTCPWKQCEPGVRMRCHALHCGLRHHLYDDLQVIKLDPAVIQAPPVELWPAALARVPVPADVEELLLVPLRANPKTGQG